MTKNHRTFSLLSDPSSGTVLTTGTCGECCHAANTKEFGEGCVVAGADGSIAWHLLGEDGVWRSGRSKSQGKRKRGKRGRGRRKWTS